MKCLHYAETVLKRIVTINISALNALIVAAVARKPGLTTAELQIMFGCSPGPISSSPYLKKGPSKTIAHYSLNAQGRELARQLFSKPSHEA